MKSESRLEASKWISIKDGLPEDGQLVLIHQNCSWMSNDFINKVVWFDGMCDKFRGWTFDFEARDDDSSYNDVTHWMPLPEPPTQ